MATVIEQLELMRDLQENWDGDGAAPPRAGAIDAAIALVRQCATRIALPHPYVAPTRAAGVLLEWEQGPHQLEVELDNSDCGSFVYLNRETGEQATGTLAPAHAGTVLPLAVTAILSAWPTITMGA